jgi:hypothetical protein
MPVIAMIDRRYTPGRREQVSRQYLFVMPSTNFHAVSVANVRCT